MLRVFTAFSGYDSQCLALNRANIDYELVGWSEIDKFAIKAHNALFPQWTDRNFGDISKIDWNLVPDFDLFTYSSPCQDFSNAGKMAGGEKGSGTRSSLLWECEKAIRAKMPKYLLENVANLVSKKFIGTFQNWLNVLSELGYTNYWQILNAKDYGVPQNRKRVFVVSILNCTQPYYFPEPFKTDIRLKDVLEGYVDESYYLSDKYLERFYKTGKVWKGMSGVVCDIKKLSHTITTNKGEGLKIAVTYQQQLEPRTDGCSNTLTTVQKDNLIIEPDKVVAALRGREPIVLGWTRDKHGNVVDRHPVSIANTVTSAKRDNTQNYVVDQFRIRKLTERECFRLMGVADSESDKIRHVVSKTQCYKLAGNSIVVDVLVAIFTQLFSENKTTDKQLKLF